MNSDVTEQTEARKNAQVTKLDERIGMYGIHKQYTPEREMVERLNHNFSYHSPKGNQPHRYNVIREAHRQLAMFLAEQCPGSRELALALTALEESSMWANASIARNEAQSPKPEV